LSTPHSQLPARLGQGAAPTATIAAEIVDRIFWDSIAPSHGSALKTVQDASQARDTNKGRKEIGTAIGTARHCVISLPIDR